MYYMVRPAGLALMTYKADSMLRDIHSTIITTTAW